MNVCLFHLEFYQLRLWALSGQLNLKVKINASKNGKGSVTLKYNNPAELSSILDLLEQR